MSIRNACLVMWRTISRIYDQRWLKVRFCSTKRFSLPGGKRINKKSLFTDRPTTKWITIEFIRRMGCFEFTWRLATPNNNNNNISNMICRRDMPICFDTNARLYLHMFGAAIANGLILALWVFVYSNIRDTKSMFVVLFTLLLTLAVRVYRSMHFELTARGHSVCAVWLDVLFLLRGYTQIWFVHFVVWYCALSSAPFIYSINWFVTSLSLCLCSPHFDHDSEFIIARLLQLFSLYRNNQYIRSSHT